MATTQTRIAHGDISVDFLLEFRTWNGSAFVWTDYTDRLVDFQGVGAQVEEAAFPNAFRITFGEIVVDNTDGFWNDPETLDGVLTNASQPYGESIYKRMVRIKEERADAAGVLTTTVIGTAIVRDIKRSSDGMTATLKVSSLDSRAADQRADGDTVERHPLGGTDKTAPSEWTTTDPASDTAEVALYRWREEEPDGSQTHYGWFRNRKFTNVVELTAWALDDLATDIDDSILYTADGREVVTPRNIPPDDGSISTGSGDDRTRAIVWNPERSVLVVCVGYRVYDYDPVANTYTLQNSLTSSRQIIRIWYIDEADTDGFTKRLVIVSTDVSAIATIASPGANANRQASVYLTVYQAGGSGAYSAVASWAADSNMATDVWLGTHMTRAGSFDAVDGLQCIGQANNGTFFPPIAYTSGENVHLPFQQKVYVSQLGLGEYAHLQFPVAAPSGTPDIDGLFGTATDGEINIASGETADRGWANALDLNASAIDLAFRWTYGRIAPAMDIELYHTGGRLYFLTYDSTNGFRLDHFELFTYSVGAHEAILTAATHVPYAMHYSAVADRLYVAQMEWIESGAASYSACHAWYQTLSSGANTEATFLSGATGTDQAWMVMEIFHHTVASKVNVILFNRETLQWRFCSELTSAWSTTDAACLDLYGRTDQPNRLEGLILNTNYSTDRMFFVEAGSNMLWSWDGTTLRHENKTPATATAGDPINTDRGLGGPMTFTAVNYPDTSTPNGILFGVSANDYIDWGTDSPAGEYVLWQFANFYSGFVKLLDLEGLSLWTLRSILAVAFNYVHFYMPDGTLAFKPRLQSGGSSFSFSADNGNYISGETATSGWEAVTNDVLIKPYEVEFEERLSDIIKGESESTGQLEDVVVSSNPGETSQWRMVFTSQTAYDLYKLAGTNADPDVAKETGISPNNSLRGITDGEYLAILPENFSGAFAEGDNFTFWIFEPQETLTELGFADWVRVINQVSIDRYQRSRRSGDFDNRFIIKQLATDYGTNILDWRKDPHDVVQIVAAYDPAYLPLLLCTLTDPELGYNGTETFQIMGVQHDSGRMQSRLTLVKQ